MPRLELDVEDVAAGGDGIGHAPDGRVVFVRGAMPGDRVVVDLLEDRPRMLRGTAASVVEPSADRVVEACPHVAEGCGGCGWQHISVDGQRRLKARIAEEALRRIGGIAGRVQLGPTLATSGFRTTVRGLVADGRLALRAERSHVGVPIASCLVAHPRLDELIRDGRFGDADEVTLRVSATSGERAVVFDPTVPAGVVLPDDAQVVGVDELRSGRRLCLTETVRDRRFRVSVDAFFQTRTDGAEALVDTVGRAAGDRLGQGRMVDLYGGVGLFAGCLGDGMDVTVVEASRAAVADARHNVADRHARVIRSDVARWRPSPADLVVADPPRTGLGAAAVDRIAATGAGRVVVVSCDAASFGRDAGLLSAAGYQLRGTTLVDLFPHTSHVELVSRFDREGN